MARRTSSEDVNIGSDSFLDVIANMVGILIILIVIAGLRASQLPPTTAHTAAEQPPPANEPEPPGPLPAPEPSEEEPDDSQLAELAGRVQALEAEIAELERESSARAVALSELTAQAEAEIQQTAAAEAQLADQSDSLSQRRQQVQQLGDTLDAKKRSLARLLTELQALKQSAPPVKKIKHQVTPLSRMVQGDEIHFRLEGNRVSVVPLKELIERLLKQAERQKDWLAKYRQHQGSVGPVGGYTMHYIVERQLPSHLDQYRGPGFRIAVSAFKVIPEADLKTETAQEATRVGSDFHVALQTIKAGSTLTFWVYPDSFELYRQLEELAHDAGFQVAARPLPFGVPIAGSPDGTRSAAQ
jgi:hypothetical protein